MLEGLFGNLKRRPSAERTGDGGPGKYLVIGPSGVGKTTYLAKGIHILNGGVPTACGRLEAKCFELECKYADYLRNDVYASHKGAEYRVEFSLDGRPLAAAVLVDVRGGDALDRPASLADLVADPEVAGTVCVFGCDSRDDTFPEERSVANIVLCQNEPKNLVTLFTRLDCMGAGTGSGRVGDIIDRFPKEIRDGPVAASSSRDDSLYSPAVWYAVLAKELERTGDRRARKLSKILREAVHTGLCEYC